MTAAAVPAATSVATHAASTTASATLFGRKTAGSGSLADFLSEALGAGRSEASNLVASDEAASGSDASGAGAQTLSSPTSEFRQLPAGSADMATLGGAGNQPAAWRETLAAQGQSALSSSGIEASAQIGAGQSEVGEELSSLAGSQPRESVGREASNEVSAALSQAPPGSASASRDLSMHAASGHAASGHDASGVQSNLVDATLSADSDGLRSSERLGKDARLPAANPSVSSGLSSKTARAAEESKSSQSKNAGSEMTRHSSALSAASALTTAASDVQQQSSDLTASALSLGGAISSSLSSLPVAHGNPSSDLSTESIADSTTDSASALALLTSHSGAGVGAWSVGNQSSVATLGGISEASSFALRSGGSTAQGILLPNHSSQASVAQSSLGAHADAAQGNMTGGDIQGRSNGAPGDSGESSLESAASSTYMSVHSGAGIAMHSSANATSTSQRSSVLSNDAGDSRIPSSANASNSVEASSAAATRGNHANSSASGEGGGDSISRREAAGKDTPGSLSATAHTAAAHTGGETAMQSTAGQSSSSLPSAQVASPASGLWIGASAADASSAYGSGHVAVAGRSSGIAGGASTSPFQVMDATQSGAAGAVSSSSSSASSLSAGYHDPQLGYVELKAHMGADGVHASLATATPESSSLLAGQMPALHQWLHERQTPVETLSVALREGSVGQNPGETMGQGSSSGREAFAEGQSAGSLYGGQTGSSGQGQGREEQGSDLWRTTGDLGAATRDSAVDPVGVTARLSESSAAYISVVA